MCLLNIPVHPHPHHAVRVSTETKGVYCSLGEISVQAIQIFSTANMIKLVFGACCVMLAQVYASQFQLREILMWWQQFREDPHMPVRVRCPYILYFTNIAQIFLFTLYSCTGYFPECFKLGKDMNKDKGLTKLLVNSQTVLKCLAS